MRILNRLVTRVNTGQGKNVPVSIIVDELPTLYFHKIDRLIGTARSNKGTVGGSMNIPGPDEFKASKFFCKTDFNMTEIKKEEAAYAPLSKFYTFKSRDELERILYKNFVQVGQDVKEMIVDISNKKNVK